MARPPRSPPASASSTRARLRLAAAGRSATLYMFELGLSYTETARRLNERLFPGQLVMLMGDSKVRVRACARIALHSLHI